MHASLKLANDPLEFNKLGSPIVGTERPVRREAPYKNESDRTSYSNDEFVESDRNKTGKVSKIDSNSARPPVTALNEYLNEV